MLEVLRYKALNALNTVQKIKVMSKISNELIKSTHKGCKAMYVEDVEDGKRTFDAHFGS